MILLAAALIGSSCAPVSSLLGRGEGASPPPEVPREFRGVWIATVDNIDWPSEPGLPAEAQKAELRALLDRAIHLNMNAVVFQVRPTADALYDSPLEPWSYYLTGTQGEPPEPYYDPLAFAIEEAHRRGLELHAWFNPYRAYHPTAPDTFAATHQQRQRPDLVRTYGDLLWLDPGEPDATEHTLGVILDVVRRYDVDGIHLDDYFYPYPTQVQGEDVPFPDAESYARAVASGETLARDDWRRQNVNLLVERIYRSIKQLKPWVKFGISPFGIWRPGYPEQITGFDQYARLYADARLWQQEGWVDYFSPQLYWNIASAGQSFPVLLDWWAAQNTADRHLWPGQATYRIGSEGARSWLPSEIAEQIRLVRAQPEATGTIHFSMQVLERNPEDIAGALVDIYEQPALVPASPWLDAIPPGQPQVDLGAVGGRTLVTLAPGNFEPVWKWVVRVRHGRTWTLDIVPGWHVEVYVDRDGRAPDEVVVSAVDRVGNEGPAFRVVPARPGADRVTAANQE